MKIISIIPRLNYSGAPKMIAWVSNQLSQNGNEVTLITLFSDIVEQKLDSNIHCISLNIARSKSRIKRNTVQMFYLIKKIKEVIDDIKPDCILSFLDASGYFLLWTNRFFWRKRNIKMVISERGDPYTHSGLSSLVKNKWMKYADVIVFQTEGAKKYYQEAIQKKGVVIPNPVVSEKKYVPVEYKDRKDQIVTAGRLFIEQKRQDLLLDAFQIVSQKHPEVNLVIYGDGEDLEKIRELIEIKKLNNVYLPGSVKNVKELIRDNKVFVLTSDYEGIPNSLIEAMEVGMPCVATDCSPGGAKTLIRDGINGFIVPRNDPKEIARKIILLLEDEALSDSIAREAVKICDVFSEANIAAAWNREIDKCVQSAKSDV